MALGALIIGSLLLLVLLGATNGFNLTPDQNAVGAIMVITVCAIITCAATISNDNIQDLKAGQMVGATPWKQQAMLILGVFVSACVTPLVLRLLFEAYGIGNVFPHPGMDPNQALSAPQATGISFVVQGVFAHTLPWGMLGAGAAIAVLCMVSNIYLHRFNFSIPALGVGMGIYLPFDTNMPIIIGGIASFLIHRIATRRYGFPKNNEAASIGRAEQEQLQQAKHKGLILACGIVAGSTIMGVILAIPFAISHSTEVWSLAPAGFEMTANILGTLATAGLVWWFYRTVCQKPRV
jgi:putative OPT family oligopeptide transporter